MKLYKPAILSDGFRLFFISAALIAIFNMVVWVGYLAGYFEIYSLFTPIYWHLHEMMFGFISAVIAGFLLTAVPNWTGRQALKGKNILMLWALWLFGRVVTFYSEYTGIYFAAMADTPFYFILSLYVFWQIREENSKRNMPIALLLLLLGAANTLMYVSEFFELTPLEYGFRFSIMFVALLIMLIGGRIIPNFTANYLRQYTDQKPPTLMNKFDIYTITASLITLFFWAIFPDNLLAGVLLIFIGILHIIRLSRWRIFAVRKAPILLILHVAYIWLAIGYLALGLFILFERDYADVALHIITVGAFTNMIMGMMTRASLGHTGRQIVASKVTVLIYVVINLAAIARVVAPFNDLYGQELLYLSAVGWIIGFGLFVIEYTPYFLTARK